ncbi:NEDD4 family-interacting protein 1-like [Rhincodon typus]|uniref:NEDD4 family-interacting protein 1-like n=1 Tax=Rhincodon typus TaxID=259920 RepID=UPI0020308C74|nr:NEDD4 family-interacting protein 1-like [Rhincodon typus]
MEFNGKPIIFCEYDDEFTLGDGYDEGNQLSLGNDGIFLVTFFRFVLFTRGFVNYAKVRKVTAKIASLKKSRYFPEYFLP